MMKCKNCLINDAIKYSKYSNGEFCSRQCSRSYSTKNTRQEINKRVSEKLKGCKKTHPKRKEDYDSEIWDKICKKRIQVWDEKILNSNYSDLSFGRLRRRIILEQNNKCNKCKNDEWLGQKITLELEHKDGNHSNNNRENLEMLCPNCHSYTKTWRGRNKNNNKCKISDENLLKSLIKNKFNVRQALLEVGLTPKGGNYKKCYILKKEYNDL